MAQTQTPPLQRTMINDFETMVHALIAECARYAAEGPGEGGTEEEASGNIRRLRILVGSLNSALQGLQFMPPRMGAPPPEPAELEPLAGTQPRPAAPPRR